MAVSIIDALSWLQPVLVLEAPEGDRSQAWPETRVPEDGRAARRTEMKLHLLAAVAYPGIHGGGTQNLGCLGGKKHRDTESRPRAPLTSRQWHTEIFRGSACATIASAPQEHMAFRVFISFSWHFGLNRTVAVVKGSGNLMLSSVRYHQKRGPEHGLASISVKLTEGYQVA